MPLEEDEERLKKILLSNIKAEITMANQRT